MLEQRSLNMNCHSKQCQSLKQLTKQNPTPIHHTPDEYFLSSAYKDNMEQASTKHSITTQSSIRSSLNINLSKQDETLAIKKQVNNFTSLANSLIKTQKKLDIHLDKMIKCDKYIRLITSILKTYRAYHSNIRIQKMYKQLVMFRRVIRFQSKYQTIIELLSQKLSFSMKAFKIMQLLGDLTDLLAYWLLILNKSNSKSQKLIERFQQYQSNFYFAQCCIWTLIYYSRYCQTNKLLKSTKIDSECQKINQKSHINMLKTIKYLLDVLTSYNNSSLVKYFAPINKKIAGFLTIFSSCIGLYLIWI